MAGQSWRKGPWTPEEDKLLVEYVGRYGDGRWSCVSKCAGLNRSGKSCRLRWVNYLRPGLKKGHITPQEEGIIIELHALWGNKWSTIARYLPGRTDNEIKNYWRTHFKKRKPNDHNNHQEKGKTQQQTRKESKSSSSNLATSSDHVADIETRHEEEGEGKKETVSESTTSMESDHHHHQLINHVTQPDYNPCSWSGFVPVDNYLFGGLWDMDDLNGCSRMAIQNQTFTGGGGGGGGDHVKYMCCSNGGYIF